METACLITVKHPMVCVLKKFLFLPLFALILPTTGSLHALAQQWETKGSMSLPRRDHTATLLTNGKVLILGWLSQTAELYDPAAGVFLPAGDTIYNHGPGVTATRLLGGKVLILGGIISPQIAEIYDPATGAFELTGNPIGPKKYHSATLLRNGIVFIAGGQGHPDNATHNVAELYDPLTGRFQPTAQLRESRCGHSAVLLPNGNVLISGGSQTTTPGDAKTLKSTEIYDASKKVFFPGADMLSSGIGHVAVLLNNGKVLITGDGSSAQLYEPETNKFTYTGSMTMPHGASRVITLPSGKVLVTGGVTAVGPKTTNGVEIYDPAKETFSLSANMTVPRQQHTATLLPDGRVLVTGGSNPTDKELSSAELFSEDVKD